METAKVLLTIGAMIAVLALGLWINVWIARRLYRAIRAKARGLVKLIPGGVSTTGTILSVHVDQSGEHLRTYSSYEYFDQHGQRHTGQIGGPGWSEGDPIELSYLPSDPKVHEVAEVVDKLRAKRRTA